VEGFSIAIPPWDRSTTRPDGSGSVPSPCRDRLRGRRIHRRRLLGFARPDRSSRPGSTAVTDWQPRLPLATAPFGDAVRLSTDSRGAWPRRSTVSTSRARRPSLRSLGRRWFAESRPRAAVSPSFARLENAARDASRPDVAGASSHRVHGFQPRFALLRWPAPGQGAPHRTIRLSSRPESRRLVPGSGGQG